MLTFLRICKPLDNDDYFKRLLIRPLKNGEPEGVEMLKVNTIPLSLLCAPLTPLVGFDDPRLHSPYKGDAGFEWSSFDRLAAR